MKLSTQTRYGARALLTLALRYGQGPVNIKEIAAEQGLPAKYLERLMSELGAAGLVRSVRGMYGGYLLARPPQEINLRQVFEALEGADGFVGCTARPELCPRSESCVTREIWEEMYQACMAVLEATTLAILVQRSQDKWQQSAYMYYI